MIEGFFFGGGGGMKFSIPGFFWVGKFGKYFLGWVDLSRDFLGIQNNLKIRGGAHVSWPRINYNQTCFAVVLILMVSHYIASVS